MKIFFKNLRKFLNGLILIIRSSLQIKKYNIGVFIIIRFILDIFFIYLVNIIKYKKIKNIFFNHYNKKFYITYNWFGNNAQIWFFFF